MNRDEARRDIRESWRELLPAILPTAQRRVNGEDSYICPFCGHGSNGDGLTFNPKSRDENSLKCFGCGWSGDILDLYGKMRGEDYNHSLKALAEMRGITIDPYRMDRAAEDFKPQPDTSPAEPEPTADYREYYRACRERLTDPRAAAYLQGRGISLETADEYLIGFDPEADPANAPGAMGNAYRPHPAPRIIIPCSSGHYETRSIDPDTPKGFQKLGNKGASKTLFNGAILHNGAEQVFITEGPFDALSLLEVGADAIALASTSQADALLHDLEENGTTATLILCQDNDPEGKKATQKLREGLTRLNIDFTIADIAGNCKDPNERLQKDREGFIQAVCHAQQVKAQKPDNTSLYIDAFMREDVERFKDEKKTGFEKLDKEAGGLYGGLYVLAAPSSLGKTTFALQMADQLAENGHDVVYFSLEQSKLELVSKSLARITAQAGTNQALTSLAIRKGGNPSQVQAAAQTYKNRVGDRVSIIEGNFNCNTGFIADYIRRYHRKTGARPVVIIDYLQLLQPTEDKRQTTKEVMDTTVTTLKRMSREMDLTIIAISSINRTNYLTPIDFESLKESGSIEYTADVVWGLQYAAIHDKIFDSATGSITKKREKLQEAKESTPRIIELVCLKNRYGHGYKCTYEYYPAQDRYKEVTSAEEDFKTDPQKIRER